MTATAADAKVLVRRHLEAVSSFDWSALDRTASRNGRYSIQSGEQEHEFHSLGAFYRHVTQAWDLSPEWIDLKASDGGIVLATMRLTNGGEGAKTVHGHYHVEGAMIDAIRLIDGGTERRSNG